MFGNYPTLLHDSFSCTICEKRKPRYAIAAELPNGDNFDYCCTTCANDHTRGKFEGNGDLEGIGKALILYDWSMNGSADDFMGNSEYSGYFERIGNYITCSDSRGFFTFEEYADEEAAIKEWDRLYKDGCGADESDAFIQWERNGYSVSFEGKFLGEYPRMTRAMAAVSVEMRRSGYWPNVWEVSDHGNLQLIEVW